VPQAKHLLIGSTRAYSGKSATILGLAIHLQTLGLKIGYGKPLGTFTSQTLPEFSQGSDADVDFITQTLKLPETLVRPTLLNLDKSTLKRRLTQEDTTDYQAAFKQQYQSGEGDLLFIEAPANTAEGALFGLSLREMSDCIEVPILLVARFASLLVADHLLKAKERLEHRLLGVVINDIPESQLETCRDIVVPFLESRGIAVLAIMPEDRILRSVSVQELVDRLGAAVLYAPENSSLSDLMVEDLKIGAMDVNSAQLFFRNSYNKAVITGSNRLDIQLAALETSTNCLVLTGPPSISAEVLQRATEYEVPILSVPKDTLTTVEIIESCLGQVRLHEGVKVRSIQTMMAQHFNFDRLLSALDIKPVVPV
jgi:BioD-like phosphotransacetylase family protein